MAALGDSAAPAAPDLATVCLVDADADLARAVPDADRALARRALNLRELAFDPEEPVRVPDDDGFALVVVSGVVWRETTVADATAPQLLDPGAIVLREPAAASMLTAKSTVLALTETRAAVLDQRFLLAAARWPQLAEAIFERVAEQQRETAMLAAIAHLPRVEERVEFLLWHLAERWGRVCPDGVHVDLRLTHAALGRFVGARRPTVSLALTQLKERGLVERGPRGTWILLGDPPPAPGEAALPPPELV